MPASIVVTGSTADLASGSNRLVTATVKDAAGNTVTSDNTTTVTFAQTAGSGSVGGLGTASASAGVATKTVSGVLAGPVTITASAPLLTSDAITFAVVPGPGDHLTFTSSAANLTAGGARTVTAEVRDAAGNLVTGDSSTSVTFAKTGGAGTVTGLGSATASSGVTSKSVTAQLAGPITIQATAAGLASDSTTFTIVPGAADHLTITSSAANLASGSHALADGRGARRERQPRRERQLDLGHVLQDVRRRHRQRARRGDRLERRRAGRRHGTGRRNDHDRSRRRRG